MNENNMLASLPNVSLAEFQVSALAGSMNPLAQLSAKAGKSDTVMHIGTQLKSEEIVGHALTIIRVGFAALPVTNPDTDEIVYQVDENGEVICDDDGYPLPEMSVYPICHFKEAPGYWYNGGKLLKENIMVWADACGDDPDDDYNLPNTNAKLTEIGGIRCFFAWGESRKTGRKYMKMIVA